jgi:hypothetical protein
MLDVERNFTSPMSTESLNPRWRHFTKTWSLLSQVIMPCHSLKFLMSKDLSCSF